MNNEKLKVYQKFVQDPEWHVMEKLISDSFDVSYDVRTIDTSQSDNVIIGDIVSRKRLSEVKENLLKTFEIIKQRKDKEPKKVLR